jgi:tetratricopeptide (TPR) repeat protein
LTSLFFHVVSTLLLFLVLKKMTGEVWPSAFVAAAFALHPLHVESVAWVSERKDVLSGFFWMLTMTAYVQYAERPTIRRYLAVVLALFLGLLSKPMLVTLPFVLLLLDYWSLSRFQPSQPEMDEVFSKSNQLKSNYQSTPAWHLIKEKIPLFVLVAASSVITFVVQQRAGAMEFPVKLPLILRISNSLLSYISYIGKMIYPSRLAVFYPFHKIPSWQPMVCLTVLVVISTLIIFSRRRYLTVGWLWYLGTLLPVIGLVQVGEQALADRYTYLPSIGIFIMVAWGAAELGAKWRFRKMWLRIPAGIVLVILMICTRMQVRHWRDDITLYKHSIEVTENNLWMHALYGEALYQRGNFDEAAAQFKEALRINPRYSMANKFLGRVLLAQGKFDEAIKCFNAVLFTGMDLSTDKDLPKVYGDLGGAYAFLREDKLAIANLTRSIELDSNSADSLNNLAWVLATTEDTKLRNPTDAVKYAIRACELAKPTNQFTFLDTLAVAYAAAGRFDDAVTTAQQAVDAAKASGQEDLCGEIQKRLELYKVGQPYRQK